MINWVNTITLYFSKIKIFYQALPFIWAISKEQGFWQWLQCEDSHEDGGGSVSSPHRCCSNAPARCASSHAKPAPSLQPAAAPSASDTASECVTNNTWHTETHNEWQSNTQHPSDLWGFYEFSLDHLKEPVVRHFDVPGHVPGEMDHGNDGFDALQLVPLVSLHGQFVLVSWRRKHTHRHRAEFIWTYFD